MSYKQEERDDGETSSLPAGSSAGPKITRSDHNSRDGKSDLSTSKEQPQYRRLIQDKVSFTRAKDTPGEAAEKGQSYKKEKKEKKESKESPGEMRLSGFENSTI